ncbi:MAG: DNA double-strand break repair nuclease NurA, partial [Anaerolineales bacterium]
SANIRWGGKGNVRDSFRAILDKQFLRPRTRFQENNYHTSLRSTLFELASRRPGDMHTGDRFRLKIYKCPDCGKGPIEVEDIEEQQYCSFCGAEVYPTDCLRLWEEINDYQSNQVAISRLMMILEHLIPIHYMRFFYQRAYLHLTRMAFFIDGPLAIFGNAAWMHRSIMIFVREINEKLARKSQPPMVIIGLQKTGQIQDHLELIERFIPENRLFAINDDYRYKYILSGREPSSNGFGFETYYGQDFIYKTPSGRTFVLGLPYPFSSKDTPGIDFPKEKIKWEHYPQLGLTLRLINHLESDLYKNAVVPIALAHRYTAISLQPGGHVLDLITRRSLNS